MHIQRLLPAVAALLMLSACASSPATRQAAVPASVGAAAEPGTHRAFDAAASGPIAADPAPLAHADAARATPEGANPAQESPAPPIVVTTEVLSESVSEPDAAIQALYASAPVRDPWEAYNRKIHSFNNGADKFLFRPIAIAYDTVAPKPVKTGVRNFFGNLGQPATAVSQVVQGRPVKAMQSLGRFVVNATVGVAGLFDPATRFGMPRYNEDVGQVFARWGWRNSRYFVVPLLGPSTVRDTFGRLGDQRLSPITYVDSAAVANSLLGLQLADGRARMLPMDKLRRQAPDDYSFVRDAWAQRRQRQIVEEN